VTVVRPFGEGAFLVESLSPEMAGRMRDTLLHARTAGVVALVPGRSSLLVEFDPLVADAERLRQALEETVLEPGPEAEGRLRQIPVVYGGEYGPDLDDVAALAGLTPAEVVQAHTATELRVLFCGFAPGFAYLGDVADPLAVPRLPTPRARTPAGSVALADGMSGIYPADLPGGWRVIGRTPVTLFDAHRDPPTYLAPGDRVRFTPIDAGDWDAHAEGAADW
jgi:KipI family sensor histidine kinase inhibitor